MQWDCGNHPQWIERDKVSTVHPCERSCEPEPEADMVNQPPHYARWEIEPIEFITRNDLPFWLGNVIKYTMRFDAKDGLKDLKKAETYLQSKIAELEGRPNFWERPQ